ncbi:MAG: hypothetical protein ACYTGW_11480 [Planctomycetota bacterium]|jgi:hypothetical protein
MRTTSWILVAVLLGSVGLLPAQQSPYTKWKNGPPADPDFFPVAVWLQNPANAGKFKAIGINTFIGLWNGPTESQLKTLKGQGMPVVAGQNALALKSPNLGVVLGWQQQDEPDNAQPKSGGGYGPPVPPAEIVKRYQAMQTADPMRPVYLNLGQGVANESWRGRGARTGKLEDYPEYIKGCDIVSFDIYPVTHNYSAVQGKLEFVAQGVDRLVKWSKGQKIVWNVVETTHVKSTVMPTPDDIRTEVWMSLIHGSMGITYFVHEWYPKFSEPALLNYPKQAAAVAAINKQIQQLAPVLNSATVVGGAKVTSSKTTVPIAHMVKHHGGATFVFAVAMRKDTTRGTFAVAGLPAKATATVLSEDREIPVANGTFQDDFLAYGVHLYRIMPKSLDGKPDKVKLSTGGTQTLELAAGNSQANRDYWVFGSVSGTFPGVRLGPVTVPLNYDLLTQLTLANPNTAIRGSQGRLDSMGTATAKIVVPNGLSSGLIGLTIHSAFVTFTSSTVHLASNPQRLMLVQ